MENHSTHLVTRVYLGHTESTFITSFGRLSVGDSIKPPSPPLVVASWTTSPSSPSK